ncbi:hypothetical protein L838_2813 [Mycobacterium avium MAV_120709_2344]|nr:hypothetical protein L838_2813 [Mycobacterium avium MAV_120709_2344]
MNKLRSANSLAKVTSTFMQHPEIAASVSTLILFVGYWSDPSRTTSRRP